MSSSQTLEPKEVVAAPSGEFTVCVNPRCRRPLTAEEVDLCQQCHLLWPYEPAALHTVLLPQLKATARLYPGIFPRKAA
jgi:hypothetical protein